MSQTVSEKAASPRSGQRKTSLLIFLVLLIIAAAGSYYWYFHHAIWFESTDDAYISGNLVQITPETAGTVTSIAADDGDFVQKGQPMVSFDQSRSGFSTNRSSSALAVQ